MDVDIPEVYAEIAMDLMQMVNNEQLSDVTFVCKDGIKVHACRMLLAARSSLFKHMLLNGMVESRLSTIRLPTISSSVFIIVLKFLYVGNLHAEDLCPFMVSREDEGSTVETSSSINVGSLRFDWNFLAKVIVAARFFMLDRLEGVILEKLRTDLPEGGCPAEDTLNLIARKLSEICRCRKLWTGENEDNTMIEAICCSVIKLLMAQDLSQATLFHLSEPALRYYLKQSRRISGDKSCEWLLDEYLRLRQILTWCAVTAFHHDDGAFASQKLDRTCLPGPEIAMHYIQSRNNNTEFCIDFSQGRTSFVNRIDKERLNSLLEFVDIASVHPELLCGVIEPFGIIGAMDLAKLLGSQAVRCSRRLRKEREVRVSNVWQVLDQNDLWRIPTDDECTLTLTSRRETRSFSVTAFAGFHMNLHDECWKYEWEIVAIPHGPVLQGSVVDFKCGFIRLESGKMLLDSECSNSFRFDGYRSSNMQVCSDLRSAVIHHAGSTHHWYLSSGNKFNWTTPLKVTVDFEDLCCSFSYGGDSITLEINDRDLELDYGHIYPAVDILVAGLNQDSFRPHYDQLTFQIRNVVGFTHMVSYAPRRVDEK